jgi:hypothetical protein
MITQSPARYPDTGAPTNDDILRAIIARRARPLLRRMHLSPDWIIGLIGDRGSGKSLGGANISVRDWGFSGSTLHSNMKTKLTVDVDEWAALFGVDDTKKIHYTAKPGSVVYESEYIDRHALNRLDARYEGGHIFADEFNLFGADARRSMSNENLDRNDLVQQLRKYQCGLTYTVLDEMFIDTRIRDATDIFIKCMDTAAYSANLNKKKPQGHDFEWLIYPMTWRFLGAEYTYKKTGKPIGPIPINLRKEWDIMDTFERQSRKYGKSLDPVELEENPEITAARSKWGWLQEKVLDWKKKGISTIESGELPLRLGCPVTEGIRQWLRAFGVSWNQYEQIYKVDDFSLEESPSLVAVP